MSIEDNLRKYAFLESGGCVIDIILFVVCCFFPVLFIFYIPYSIYSSYKFFKRHSSIGKELRMLEKNKAIMEERLKNMSTEEVKALRNKYVEILNSHNHPMRKKMRLNLCLIILRDYIKGINYYYYMLAVYFAE